MRVIPADESCRIDLPGVGPTPCPVDVDRAVTGFSRLSALRICRLSPGPAFDGESEGDEVLVIALSGTARAEVTGTDSAGIDLEGDDHLYLPPRHAFRIAPVGPCLVAFIRAEAEGRVPPQAVAPGWDGAEALRLSMVEVGAEPVALGGAGETLVYLNGTAGTATLAASLADGHPSLLSPMADGDHPQGAAEVAMEGTDALALDPGETVTFTPTGAGRLLVVSA